MNYNTLSAQYLSLLGVYRFIWSDLDSGDWIEIKLPGEAQILLLLLPSLIFIAFCFDLLSSFVLYFTVWLRKKKRENCKSNNLIIQNHQQSSNFPNSKQVYNDQLVSPF